MPRIAVVTDSSAYLPESLVQENGIHVVPLNVHFNGSVFKDLVELKEDQFFLKLAAAPELPSTSQPSAGEFAEVFRQAARHADGLVVIVISSSLSGTYSSAMAAKDMAPDIPIAVVDSRTTSMGLGFLALAAARAAREGKGLDEIVVTLEAIIPKVHVWFVLDTLKYLAKGGRIGGAQALMGSMLSIKPILQVEGGKVEQLDKVRTRGKAVERMVELFKREVDGKPVHCAVIHTLSPDDAERLKNRIVADFPDVQDMAITGVSSAIGTHVGPGALGLCFYAE